MFEGSNRRSGLVVGLLLLAAIQPAVSAQETAASASDQRQLRIWTDRSGTYRTEAAFVESKDGKVTLKKDDGATIKVPLESLSETDRRYVEQRVVGQERAEKLGGDTGGPAVEINPTDGKKSTRPASAKAKEVTVTGVGTDPDMALQNAFSQAIQQVVGVLVDAVTVVKNDQLIRDEILTYSRGYVQKYEVAERWEEDGLHHARIRAVVAQDKLVEKLGKLNIAVKSVEGEREAINIAIAVENEARAAKMLENALAGFQMGKLTKVTYSQPEVIRDGANAKLRMEVTISPDLQQWQQLSQELRRVLAAASGSNHGVISVSGNGTRGVGVKIDSIALPTTRTGAGRPGTAPQRTPRRGGGVMFGGGVGPSPKEFALQQQLEGQGILVSLLVETSATAAKQSGRSFACPRQWKPRSRIWPRRTIV